MIVIKPSLVGEVYGDITAVHEFFHAVQDGIGTYVYADDAAWYFEATAVWMEAKVYPNSTHYTKFIPSIAFLPELSLHHFDYPDGYDLAEYHHYGTALFIKHLDEMYSVDMIRDSWLLASQPDPLGVLTDLLSDHDTSVEQAFFDYFARNATWDYPDQTAILAAIEEAGGLASAESHRPSGQLRLPIQTQVTTNLHPPHELGGNYWRLHDVPETFTLTLEPANVNIEWFVVVVSEHNATSHVQSHQLSSSDLTVEFDGHDGATTTWLGVAAINTAGRAATYALRLDVPAGEATRATQAESCGCATSSIVHFWPLIFLLLRRQR